MATSIIGPKLETNITQPQNLAQGVLRGHVLLSVIFVPASYPTVFLGWAYVAYTYGGAGGVFRTALMKRVAISNNGCAIPIHNVIQVGQGGDTFMGHQVWTNFNRAGIVYDIVVAA
jgi:hypothetical protein